MPHEDSCPSSGQQLDQVRELLEAIERETRRASLDRALFHRASLYQTIGRISEEELETARVTLEEHRGRGEFEKPMDAEISSAELRRVLNKQKIYEYLLFSYQQEKLFGKDAFGIEIELWLRQLAHDDAFLTVHLVNGTMYPEFATWINRVLLRYAGRIAGMRAKTETEADLASRKELAEAIKDTALRQSAELLFVLFEEKRLQPAVTGKLARLFAPEELPGTLQDFVQGVLMNAEELSAIVINEDIVVSEE